MMRGKELNGSVGLGWLTLNSWQRGQMRKKKKKEYIYIHNIVLNVQVLEPTIVYAFL